MSSNITLIPLPPKRPELNPVENVWQFMRDNWLSNRIFTSHDDIVDHCYAWHKLVNQPWRIISLGLRQWAMGPDQCTSVWMVPTIQYVRLGIEQRVHPVAPLPRAAPSRALDTAQIGFSARCKAGGGFRSCLAQAFHRRGAADSDILLPQLKQFKTRQRRHPFAGYCPDRARVARTRRSRNVVAAFLKGRLQRFRRSEARFPK